MRRWAEQDEACQSMLKTFDLGSGHVPWFTQLENVRLRSGWRAAWEQWIKAMLDIGGPGYLQPYYLVEAVLGSRDAMKKRRVARQSGRSP